MIKVDGALLKEYRKKKGLTQVQLAEGICTGNCQQYRKQEYVTRYQHPKCALQKVECRDLRYISGNRRRQDQKKLSEIQSLNAVSKYKESYEILQTIDQKK